MSIAFAAVSVETQCDVTRARRAQLCDVILLLLLGGGSGGSPGRGQRLSDGGCRHGGTQWGLDDAEKQSIRRLVCVSGSTQGDKQQVTRSICCRKKTSRIKYNGTIGRIYFYISHFGCMTHSYRGGFPNRRMFKTSKFCKLIFRRRFEQPKYFRRYEYSTN